jgi:hypothetical protein
MRSRLSILLTLCLALTVASCGKKSDNYESGRAPAPAMPVKSSSAKIARDASLTMEAKNVRDAAMAVSATAQKFGGTVEHSNITQGEEDYANLTLRVAADTLESFLKALHGLGYNIPSEDVTAQDVTEAYSANENDLATKKATLERLKMLENRPKSVGDEIELQKQIAALQTEIDAAQNGPASVASQVRYSRVTVWIRPTKPGFFEGIGLGLSHGFSSISDVLQTVITVAIAGIPAFLLLFLIILIFRKLLRRFDKGSKDKTAER